MLDVNSLLIAVHILYYKEKRFYRLFGGLSSFCTLPMVLI